MVHLRSATWTQRDAGQQSQHTGHIAEDGVGVLDVATIPGQQQQL